MNKQAITFLSLFTLILVLSIYYLVVPPIENDVNVSSKEVNNIDVLQKEIDSNHQENINNNNDVIASATSSKKEINEALSSIEKTNEQIKIEKNIKASIKSLGYDNCAVEINQNKLKVVIMKKNSTSKDANEIIKLINGQFKDKYYIEVKFIDK